MRTALLLLLFASVPGDWPALLIEKQGSCRIFKAHKLNACLKAELPPDNPTPGVYLVVAAAFTEEQKIDHTLHGPVRTYKPANAIMVNGKFIQRHGYKKSTPGSEPDAVVELQGPHGMEVKIWSSVGGKQLTTEKLVEIGETGASLFQQFLLVKDGVAQFFKAQKPLPRRALATFKDKSFAVIDCTEKLDLASFTTRLVELGAQQAALLDTGAWDEGWYRDTLRDNPKTLGLDRSRTEDQTNWLLFQEHECHEEPLEEVEDDPLERR